MLENAPTKIFYWKVVDCRVENFQGKSKRVPIIKARNKGSKSNKLVNVTRFDKKVNCASENRMEIDFVSHRLKIQKYNPDYC